MKRHLNNSETERFGLGCVLLVFSSGWERGAAGVNLFLPRSALFVLVKCSQQVVLSQDSKVLSCLILLCKTAPHTDLQIVDPSGKKNVAVDLTRALNQINSNSGIQIKVEVTDETQRTYDTMVTVRVEDQPVKVEFDKVRTDLVYRTGMPIQVVVRQGDCCALVVEIGPVVVGISALVVQISTVVVGISALEVL